MSNNEINNNNHIEVKVEYSVVLRKKTKVTTIDYTLSNWEQIECDVDGRVTRIGGTEITYENADLLKEYKTDHYTPTDLIMILRFEMERKLREHPDRVGAKDGTWQRIIDECKNWVSEDESVDNING